MNGTALEIYLKTIATGDGAQKTVQEYKAIQAAAAKASDEMKRQADEVFRAQQKAANPWGSAARGKSVIENHTAWQQQIQSINASVEATKKAAAADAQLEAAHKRLAEAGKRTQAFFAPVAINPWVTASAGATRATDSLANAQAKAAGSSRNLGGAILQASRGIQDMQYGLAGAVNNLEGIASALGLGAGVAGAVTLFAVAVQQLGPHVLEWLKGLDAESNKLENLKAILERSGKAIEGDYTGNVANAKRISEEFTVSLDAQAKALDATTEAIERQQKRQGMVANVAAKADELKLKSDIEDIKSQGLPANEETAAIATRKRQSLDTQKKRDDQLAQSGLDAQADKLNASVAARNELVARQSGLEKERENSAEYARLAGGHAGLEQKELEAQRAADSQTADVDPTAILEARQKAAEARAKVTESKARMDALKSNAPGGRIRGTDEITAELEQVKPRAKSAVDQVDKDAADLREKVADEKIAKVGRDNVYQREAEKIAREQFGGVMDKNNLASPPPGLMPGPAPLPAPAAPGSSLPPVPEGFGVPELNPERIANTATGGGFGAGDAAKGLPVAPASYPQAGSQASTVDVEKSTEKVSGSFDDVVKAVMRMADTSAATSKAFLDRLSKVESKIRSMGVMGS